MKKEPSGKILIVLGVWAIIAYAAFPFPVNLIIGFIGMVVIIALLGLAEYAVETEKQEPIVFAEEELTPTPKPKSKKKIRSGSLPEKNRPKVRVEIENDNNRWDA